MRDAERDDRAMERRTFLRGMAGSSAVLGLAGGSLTAGGPAVRGRPAGPAGLIARQRGPDNLEFPFSTLQDFLTPNDQFFVRSHFAVPELEAQTWRLKVEGAVRHPLELGYDELRELPSRTMTALLECSGNGRVFLKPPQIGIRWELGAVGNAEWTGVSLAAVLERAGVEESAVEVILEGADRGEFREPEPRTPGTIPYARSLPLAKAMNPEEILLAYRMNGEELPREHGFPMRAVVAGWYGMASVKWLGRILVVKRPFAGYFQTLTYAVWERRHGLPSLLPVSELQVKAQIARPASGEVVPAGTEYRVHGAAWSVGAEVAKVEFSADGGRIWEEAKQLGQPVPHAWRLWEHAWKSPTAGRHVLMVRAADARGQVQPMARDEDRRDAMISHVLPIDVVAR